MKKGEQLLDMIMEGGNFGQYNKDIDRTIKKDSAMSFITRNRRNLRLLNEYPEEVLWGPALGMENNKKKISLNILIYNFVNLYDLNFTNYEKRMFDRE